MTVKELREKRARLITEARAVYNKADAEQRSLTSDEEQTFDRMTNEADQLRSQIDRLEKLTSFENEQNESRGRLVGPNAGASSMAPTAHDALRGWLMLGTDEQPTDAQLRAVQAAGLTGKHLRISLRQDALRSGENFRDWQSRAQAVGTGAAGGFLVAPDFSGEIDKALLAFGGMRQASRVLRTATGADMPYPLGDDTMNEAVIIPENGQISDTPDLQFTDKTLKSWKYTSNIVKVSRELLQDSAINIAEIVGASLGERVARGTNRHFTVGDGTTQPEGAVTAATLALTAASATTVTYDEVLDLIHSVDPAYRANGAKFMLNDQTFKAIRKVKDSTGRPLLWDSKDDLADGIEGTILGYQYIINQHMAPIGSAAKSILFGDFSRHIIRDVQDLVLTRLDERYAEYGQVAFVALSRHDSRLLDAGKHPVQYLQQAV